MALTSAERSARYRAKNRELCNARCKAWREAQGDNARSYHREWYHKKRANSEEYKIKLKERNAKYYRTNTDKIKEQTKAYKKENPEAYRIYSQRGTRKYRELKKGLDHMYTKLDEIATRLVFPNCVNCGSDTNLEVDHFYPLSKGFGLSLDNAIILCRSCNASKQNKLPKEFFDMKTLNNIEYNLAALEASEVL